MKKTLLFLASSFVFILTLTAQIITQEKANGIIWKHLINETEEFTVFAKKGVQPQGSTITTSIGEVIELDYSGWIYYVHYPFASNSKYLIVKEVKENLLEINAKNDEGPTDLDAWKVIPIKVCDVDNPLTDLPWFEVIIKRLEGITYYTPYIGIYQCSYKDGIGFLVFPDISGYGFQLWNCEGKMICSNGGTINNCVGAEIDFESSILIWSKNP